MYIALPQPFNRHQVERRMPIAYDKPFNTFLNKEVQRFNILIATINEGMKGVIASLEGMRKMDAQSETTINSLKVH